jgi:penicillin-binding protein 2
VIEDATLAVVASATLDPGVVVQQVPTRQYPSEELAAHLFGYVGEVTETQLVRPEFGSLQAGAIVGQAGVEQAFNNRLMGTDGNRYVKVNASPQIESARQDAVEGQRLQLTIDYDLQRAPKTGSVGFNGATVFHSLTARCCRRRPTGLGPNVRGSHRAT